MIDSTPFGASAPAGSLAPAKTSKFGLGIIDFGAIETDPKANLLPRGAYLGIITEVRANAEKSRAEFIIDVAEGPRSGFFEKRPEAPSYVHTLYLSFDAKRILRLKLDLATIGSYNPGFNPFETWNNDASDFVGKRLGFTVNYREKHDSRGEVGSMPNYSLIPADAMATGSYRIPGDIDLGGTRAPDSPGIPLSFTDEGDDERDADDLWGDGYDD